MTVLTVSRVTHDPNIYLLFQILTKKRKKVMLNLRTNAVFTIKVPVKNAFLGFCHRFQEIIILPKQFCRTTKTFRSMPISSDVGQLKPK